MRETDWFDKALCKGLETNAFFPSSKEPNCDFKIKQAKKICSACPVRLECLTHAIVNKEAYGIWGGMTERRISRLRNEIGETDEDFVFTYLKVRMPSVLS
jgi:WhiB family redox-sensing transcriptional regulator